MSYQILLYPDKWQDQSYLSLGLVTRVISMEKLNDTTISFQCEI